MISALESLEQGKGLYSFREAAKYLRMNPNTLRSWFRTYTERAPILDSEIRFDDDGDYWLSFNDFIEASIIAYLKEQGATPKAVREALQRCETEWGLKYPLSLKSVSVFVDRSTGEVFVTLPGHQHPVEGTGPHRNQLTHIDLVQAYLSKIEYDEKGMASRYVVWQGDVEGKLKRVVMSPSVNFGEPSVEGTPYRAVTLKDAAEAEGTAEEAARLYEVEKGDVIIAIEAFNRAPELRMAA